MDRVTATAMDLIDVLRAADFEPRSYSGRAMYGARGVSVTVRGDQVLALAGWLVLAATERGKNPALFAALMDGARQDSMGRDVVIYWPQLKWPAEDLAAAPDGGLD